MAVSIFGYSGAYLKNINAVNPTQGAQGAGTSPSIQIFEPKIGWPEKAGDAPYQSVPFSIPTTRFDGTALVAGDLFYFAPLGAGVKVEAMVFNLTTAATGTTFTINIGNNTSATAYAAALDLKTATATTVTVATLNLASAGVGNNDAILGAVATTSSPAGVAAGTLNIQYGVGTTF